MTGETPNEPENFVKQLSQTFARRFGGTPEDNETLAMWVEMGIADSIINEKPLVAISPPDKHGMHNVVTMEIVTAVDGSLILEKRSTYITGQELGLMQSLDEAESLLPPGIEQPWLSIDRREPPDEFFS